MELLYDRRGFEQETEPQVCLKGSLEEFEHFITIVGSYLQNGNKGELALLQNLFKAKSEYIVSFYYTTSENKLIKNGNKFTVSLNKEIWGRVLELLVPLTKKTGYQFIEFDSFSLNADITLLCQSF